MAESHALAAEATVDLTINPTKEPRPRLAVNPRSTASGPSEQALRLALAQARLRMVINSGTGSATVAAWNPTRKQIAVTGPKGTVELWNAQTGRMTASLPLVTWGGRVTASLRPHGNETGCRGAVRLRLHVAGYGPWDGNSEIHLTFATLNSLIARDANDGRKNLVVQGVWDIKRFDEFIVFGTGLDNVLRFETKLDETVATFDTPLSLGARTVVPSPDGTELLVDAEVINFAANTSVQLSSTDGANAGRACWYANGSAVVSWDITESGDPVVLSSPTSGAELDQINTFETPSAVACSNDANNTWVAAGDGDGNVDLRTASGAILPLSGHSGGINAIASSPDGRYLATASGDGTSRIWDSTTGRAISVLPGDGRPNENVAYGPGDGLVLTTNALGDVRVWDSGVGEPLATLHDSGRNITPLGFTGQGQQAFGISTTSTTPNGMLPQH